MRRWLTILAVFSVVFHAGLLVRHSAAMVTAKLDHHALVTALAVICHASGGPGATGEPPFVPIPVQSECPVCGTLCAMAVTPVPDQVLAEVQRCEQSVVVSRHAVRIAEVTAGRRPPPTGPPTLI